MDRITAACEPSIRSAEIRRYSAARVLATSVESGADEPFSQCTLAAWKRWRNAGESACQSSMMALLNL